MQTSVTRTIEVLYKDDGDHQFVLLEFPKLGTTEAVGFHLYESSILLARHLALEYPSRKDDDAPQKTVLELGAGSCGLAGLAMTRLGHHVTFTDLATILPSLEINVRRNALHPTSHRVTELKWGDSDACHSLGSFDLVIGADVVYDKLAVIPLLETIHACARRDAWICVEVRDEGLVESYLPTEAKRIGFHVRKVKQKFFPKPFDETGSHLRLFKLQKMSKLDHGKKSPEPHEGDEDRR